MKLSTWALLLAICPKVIHVSAFVPSPQHAHASSSHALKMAGDEFAFKTTSAAEKYSGGPVEVDMNNYNLNLEEAAGEWTATLVASSATKADGVYLEPRSNALVFVDVLTFSIKRQSGQGLGIELLELAGGRNDGVGITVVSGFVEGSVSEGSGLVPGDSITKMSVVTGALERDVATIATECCDWDKTVEKIGSLPPPSADDATEQLQVTVKRLRRKPTVSVTVKQEDDSTTTLKLFAGENLRRAMLTRGVKLNDKLAKSFLAGDGGMGDCGSDGSCGLCTVAVTEGAELLNEPNDEELTLLKGNDKWRLSCRAIVGYGMKEGTMKVTINPEK